MGWMIAEVLIEMRGKTGQCGVSVIATRKEPEGLSSGQ